MAAQPIIRIATSLGRRVRRRVAFLACGATLAIALAAAPVGAQLPLGGPIGPNQVFGALVNGSTGYPSPATIRMACFGPIRPGQTGHPLPGQTVEVFQPEVIVGHFGYTGASQPGRPGKQGPFESRLVHHAQWSPQRSDGARVTDMSGFQKGVTLDGMFHRGCAAKQPFVFFGAPPPQGKPATQSGDGTDGDGGASARPAGGGGRPPRAPRGPRGRDGRLRLLDRPVNGGRDAERRHSPQDRLGATIAIDPRSAAERGLHGGKDLK